MTGSGVKTPLSGSRPPTRINTPVISATKPEKREGDAGEADDWDVSGDEA